MKFDTIIILLIFVTIAFLLFLANGYEKKGSFAETVQISLGLKERDNSPSPEDTLVAPFADKSVKPITDKNRDLVRLPVNSIPLDQPHRSTRHVAEWLTQHVGNALILDKEKISKILTEVKPSFTEAAFKQYMNFGERTNIIPVVYHSENNDDKGTKEKTLSSYLKENPLLFSSGPMNDVYHWRYEMSMVLNLVEGELTQYRNTESSQTHKDIVLCITAIRVNNTENEDGLLIGKWQSGRCR